VSGSPAPQPPRIAAPTLVGLQSREPGAEVVYEDLDGVLVAGADLSGRSLVGASWRESRLTDLVADDLTCRGARFLDVLIESASAVGIDGSGSTLRAVEVVSSRLGAVEFAESSWTSVVLRGCRISYLSLRDAVLTDVLIDDCIIGTLDLQGAQVRRMAVAGGRLAELLLARSSLADVDLRAGRIEVVTPAAGLAGTTISMAQAVDLGPRLAAELGIRLG
jgi:uncharacterized protein YjbI with pentapeptide repeats